MTYVVYVIKNQKRQFYKGITSNLKKRLEYHNRGLSNWTKNRGPWTLFYKEFHSDKRKALKREKFLKSGKGREFLKHVFSERGAVG